MIAEAFEEAELIVQSIEDGAPRLSDRRAHLVATVAAAIEWQDAQYHGLRSVEAAQRRRDADLRLHHNVADLRLHSRAEKS